MVDMVEEVVLVDINSFVSSALPAVLFAFPANIVPFRALSCSFEPYYGSTISYIEIAYDNRYNLFLIVYCMVEAELK